MEKRSTGPTLILVGIAVYWLAGCRADVRVAPPAPAPGKPASSTTVAAPAGDAAGTAAVRTGYTVQVGALAVLDNARRLARTRNDIGLDASCYPQRSGLYRVRFGDFPSREAAVIEVGGSSSGGSYGTISPSAPRITPFTG